MDRKKELRMKYQEQKTQAGVYHIKNKRNQLSFVDSTRNINTIQRQRFMLEHHTHPNKSLQADWDKFGADAFAFEVLEILEKEPDEYYDLKGSLKKLKEKWVQQLQPVGHTGY
ncbi:GIY-YIG nuclease family protein [Alicyclobacillus ferrooxydans]|nr:GIY-YIG nuclease family protein [Alicyclobacillus ferrooxydans]